MKKKEEHIIKLTPKIKKNWEKPFLDYLDITKTKDGRWDLDTELTVGGWEIGHS